MVPSREDSSMLAGNETLLMTRMDAVRSPAVDVLSVAGALPSQPVSITPNNKVTKNDIINNFLMATVPLYYELCRKLSVTDQRSLETEMERFIELLNYNFSMISRSAVVKVLFCCFYSYEREVLQSSM